MKILTASFISWIIATTDPVIEFTDPSINLKVYQVDEHSCLVVENDNDAEYIQHPTKVDCRDVAYAYRYHNKENS